MLSLMCLPEVQDTGVNVLGLGFRVWGLEFREPCAGKEAGLRVHQAECLLT